MTVGASGEHARTDVELSMLGVIIMVCHGDGNEARTKIGGHANSHARLNRHSGLPRLVHDQHIDPLSPNSTMDTPREYLSTAKTQRHDAAQSASCAYLRSKSAYTRTSPPRDTTLLLDDHDLC